MAGVWKRVEHTCFWERQSDLDLNLWNCLYINIYIYIIYYHLKLTFIFFRDEWLNHLVDVAMSSYRGWAPL